MLKKRPPTLVWVPLVVWLVMFLVTGGFMFFLSGSNIGALGGSLIFGVSSGFMFGLAAFMALYMGS